jgi:hypothetical protein
MKQRVARAYPTVASTLALVIALTGAGAYAPSI